jgi:hypothetical protein
MFLSWCRKLSNRKSKSPWRARRALPLRLEALEDRCVPSTFQWVGTSASSNAWSDAQNWEKLSATGAILGHATSGQGDDLLFSPGQQRLINVDDLIVNFNSITFTGSGYDIRPADDVDLSPGQVIASNPAGTNTIEVPIDLAANGTAFQVNNGAELDLSGFNTGVQVLPVLVGGSLVKNGGGRLVLSGQGVNIGTVIVAQGELTLNNGLALGNSGALTQVMQSAALELSNGIHVSNELLRLENGGLLHAVGASSAWDQPITSIVQGGISVDAGDTLTVGQLQGPGELFKVGTGTLIATGAGNTTVVSEGGVLQVDSPSFGQVSLVGGTLDGTGHVGGFNANAGSDVHPGDPSFGTLTSDSSATLSAGSTFSADVASLRVDTANVILNSRLNVNGAAAIDGALLDLRPGTTQIGAQFDLLHSSGVISGHFHILDPIKGDVTLVDGAQFIVGGREFIIHYTASDVTVTFVPGAGLPAFQDRSITTPVTERRQATVSGAIVDPGPQGKFLLRVDWDDGSQPRLFRFDPSTVTASVSHRYHKDGTFTIHLAWGDDRGTSSTADLSVTVLESHKRSGDTETPLVPLSALAPTQQLSFHIDGTFVVQYEHGTVLGATAQGTLTLGSQTLTFTTTVDVKADGNTIHGTPTFVFSDGSTLTFSYDIKFDNGTGLFSGPWTVTGGTGLFAGATGGGTFSYPLSQVGVTEPLMMVGTITV